MDTPVYPVHNYLTNGHGLKSWLLTTDHKRIAILYLISITLFFFLGGLFAVMIRLELMTPAGDLVQPDTYNKLFTMHGVIMVFFFLIPSIPAVLGNFLVPLMIGAQGSGVPAAQPAELVHLHARRHRSRCTRCSPAASIPAGRSTRRTAARTSNTYVIADGARHLHRRLLVDPHRAELHRHDPQDARAGHDLVPAAAVRLGASTPPA